MEVHSNVVARRYDGNQESEQYRRLATEIKGRWRFGAEPDANEALRENPALRQFKSIVLDLAFEEFCILSESGAVPDPADFVRKYPSIDHSLFRLIDVHRYFEQHPELYDFDDDAHWPSPGDQLFDLNVLEEIGRGALARVYLCVEERVGRRQVVVKVAYDGAFEAASLGKLSHRNIVPIYSVLENSECRTSWICMPFRGRSTLCDVLDLAFEGGAHPAKAEVILRAAQLHARPSDRYEGLEPVPGILKHGSYAEGICEIAVQLASALQHAHDRGILHADLKPSNVLVAFNGVPLLLDFNLSLDKESGRGVTGGTLPYMAPECITSIVIREPAEREPGVSADVFSFGVILFQMLSGRLPFEPESIVLPSPALARQLLALQKKGCPSLKALNPDIDPFLAEIVESCLHFEPELRPASMRELEQRLRAHHLRRRRMTRWINRHKRATTISALMVAASMSVIAIFASSRAPQHVRSYSRGIQLVQEKNYKTAIEQFGIAIQANDSFEDAWYERGKLLAESNDFKSALYDFEHAYALRPSGRAAAGIGFCFSKLKKHGVACKWYLRALDSGYTSGGLYNNLAYSYMATKQYEKAEAALQRAADMGVSSATIYLNRATIAFNRAANGLGGVLPQDLQNIELAIQLQPDAKYLHCIAAYLYGWASKHRSIDLSGNVIDHLTLARTSGVDLKSWNLDKHPVLADLLKSRQHQHLLVSPASAQSGTLPEHTVPPWIDNASTNNADHFQIAVPFQPVSIGGAE